VSDVVRQTRAMLAAWPREPRFGGYLAVAEGDLVIGTCGFRRGPSSLGEVEIAYFTFPPYEGRGHATRMAQELVAIAQASPSVRRIIAHTLPKRGASTRILEKIGLSLGGEVEDPEDGRVWLWELKRSASAPGG